MIHGARKDEPSSEVQVAAIHSLYNSLEFVRENFEREVSSVVRYLITFAADYRKGRAKLHYASRLRSNTESQRKRVGRCL